MSSTARRFLGSAVSSTLLDREAVYDAWDPEKPRDYLNFNPFERNDEGSIQPPQPTTFGQY